MNPPNEQQVEPSNAERAKNMADFLTDGSGDPRNPGADAYAATAQVYASLAIAEQLERLNETLSGDDPASFKDIVAAGVNEIVYAFQMGANRIGAESMASKSEQVEIPAEGVELAAEVHARRLGYDGLADLKARDPHGAEELREEMLAALQAAAPSIRQQSEAELRDWLDRIECAKNDAADDAEARDNVQVTLEEARAHLGDGTSLDSIRQQAAQQERERVLDALSGDEANRAVTEVLDDEFAGETGGEAVTDYALAKRILEAALATLKEEDH